MNKDKLKSLAKKCEFKSEIFADEFQHSNKEELRYYLWRCELIRWLLSKYGFFISYGIYQSFNGKLTYFAVATDNKMVNFIPTNNYANVVDDYLDAIDLALIFVLENKILPLKKN